MAALELMLILLLTVLASAILDQVIPHLSLPLIQIALGVAVTLAAQGQVSITLNPELFLVLFVAPLLFHEAREADKVALWKNRATMLSYAIGLVVAIVLVVGFATHLLVPSISLAAAFALAAALGPTDPLAVASVADQANIPERQKTTLKGESLLNDASGIVSFQFAVAAVTTGTFSLANAVGEFLISFFGGLALGIAFGYALVWFSRKVRDLGLDSTTFHVLLELCAPFIAYLLGEVVGVSGIILVVACGITMSLAPQGLRPAIARANIVSSSVWHVLTFALNGIVFVMLGTQLPLALSSTWVDKGISNWQLILYVLALTLLMHAVRFVWSLVSEGISLRKQPLKPTWFARMRSAAIITLAGSKGTITLAIVFSLPRWISTGDAMVAFPQRDLIIFLACGVILVSLLLATFVVPLLAPKRRNPAASQAQDDETRIQILRTVIEELTARQTDKTRVATSQVISRYNDRIARMKSGDEDQDGDARTELRMKVLRWEEEYVFELIDRDEVDPLEGYQYLARLARITSLLERRQHAVLKAAGRFRRFVGMLRKIWGRLRKKLPGDAPEASYTSTHEIQLLAATYVVGRLQESMSELDAPTEQISELVVEYQRSIRMLSAKSPSITAIARAAEPDLEVTRVGLLVELEQIQQAYEEGRLSRAAAQKMRENVYLMQMDLEDYM